MRIILNTLYIMTPYAYVHLENDTLRVDVEHEKKMQVPCIIWAAWCVWAISWFRLR